MAREVAEDLHSEIRQRADLLKVVMEAVPGGVVHVGADGSIIQANADALRILGMRFDEATRRFVADWDPETINEDGSPCPASEYPVAKVLATGEPQAARTIGVRRPDGNVSWAIFRAIPALDPKTNTQAGAIVTFLDITERKHAEDQLRRSEARWRTLGENHPDFVVIANREMKIQSINRVLPEFEMARVIGSFGYQYIHEDHVEHWKKNFQMALETKIAQHFETRASGPGGEVVWYETILVPIPEAAEDEKPIDRVLIVARDITDRRTMIAKLAEKERLASIGMLSASVAHEIMNPLTYVLANLDFALSERCPPGARQTKAILDARDGAARMQQIVWDLRSLGRGGAEDLFYVDVRAVLETAVRLAGPEVAKNVAVHLDLVEVPGVLASESRLCQVFINLLTNAAQSLADNSSGQSQSAREIRIRTRVDEARSLVGVDVSDTGIGIEPEHLSRIFDPFFTTKRSGTGLGLSISKESLESMGGRIEVASTRGEGTTFTVWLSTTRDFRTSDPRRSP